MDKNFYRPQVINPFLCGISEHFGFKNVCISGGIFLLFFFFLHNFKCFIRLQKLKGCQPFFIPYLLHKVNKLNVFTLFL